MIAASPTTPTTTPAAIPAVFGLLPESLEAVFEGVATADVAAADEAAAVEDDDFFADDEESAGIE